MTSNGSSNGGAGADNRIAWPTRADVAAKLGRDRSWVIRREGREVHPVMVEGVHRFDPAEVAEFALRHRKRGRGAREDRGMLARIVFERLAAAEARGTLRAVATKRALVIDLEIDPLLLESLFADYLRALGSAAAPAPVTAVRRVVADPKVEEEEHARIVAEIEADRVRARERSERGGRRR